MHPWGGIWSPWNVAFVVRILITRRVHGCSRAVGRRVSGVDQRGNGQYFEKIIVYFGVNSSIYDSNLSEGGYRDAFAPLIHYTCSQHFCKRPSPTMRYFVATHSCLSRRSKSDLKFTSF